MVEWIHSVGQWFVINKDAIWLFFTSTTFASFASMIFVFIKSHFATKKNTNAVNGLKETLEATNNLHNDVDEIRAISNQVSYNVDDINNRIEKLEEKVNDTLDVVKQKVNAILDTQALVYSTIKDDKMRKNINNILTTAKLAETAEIVKLEKELEDFKTNVSTKVDDIKEDVKQTASKIKKSIAPNKAKVSRY